MIRKSTIYLLLLLTSLFSPLTSVFAQKKQMAEAENYLRSGKNFDKAEQLMTKLLKDSVNRQNPRIYNLWLQAVPPISSS